MEQGTLFKLPPKEKKARKPFVKTQQWICKRCKSSVHDKDALYCRKFDLALEYYHGTMVLAKDDSAIKCDGEKWGGLS